MFDFEKLEVYQKAKALNLIVYEFLQSNTVLDQTTKDQLRRASFSVMLNIAEGSGRFSKRDRRHFYIISRGSVFECVAIFDFIREKNLLDSGLHRDLYSKSEELSKMIFSMIRNLS